LNLSAGFNYGKAPSAKSTLLVCQDGEKATDGVSAVAEDERIRENAVAGGQGGGDALMFDARLRSRLRGADFEVAGAGQAED
jgi:hypothetical protein